MRFLIPYFGYYRPRFLTFGLAVWVCASTPRAQADSKETATHDGAIDAKTRVLVLPFSGKDGPRARAALLWRLEREPSIELVSDNATAGTVRKLGIRRWDANAYRSVAEALRVQVYIRGTVERSDFPWIIRFDVATPDDGSTVASERWTTQKLGSYTVIDPKVYQKVRTHVALLAPITASVVEPSPKSTEEASESTASFEKTASGFALKKARGLPYRAFEVSFLTGVIHRSIEADAYTYNHARYDTTKDLTFLERRSFDSGGLGALELGLRAEFYPGLFWDIDWMVPFGIVASYRHSLFTSAQGCKARGYNENGPNFRTSPDEGCPSGGTLDVPITQYQLYIGLRGRWALGDLSQPLEVITDVGFDRFNSGFDINQLKKLEFPAVIPPLVYQSIKLGLEVRYPIIAKYLILGANVAYNFGITSPDQNFIWGGVRVQDGPSNQPLTSGAQGYVLGASIRSEAPYLFDGAFWTLGFEWMRYSTLFRGQSRAAQSTVISCSTGEEDPSATDADNCSRWEVWPVAGETGDKQVDPTNFDPSKRGGIANPVNDDFIRVNLSLGWMFD